MAHEDEDEEKGQEVPEQDELGVDVVLDPVDQLEQLDLSGTYERNRPRPVVVSKWTMHAYLFY